MNWIRMSDRKPTADREPKYFDITCRRIEAALAKENSND